MKITRHMATGFEARPYGANHLVRGEGQPPCEREGQPQGLPLPDNTLPDGVAALVAAPDGESKDPGRVQSSEEGFVAGMVRWL